ncbi:MAG: hypothetical protein LBH51_04140 [Treponema sp.]|jgi:hypothetical protein|nr:hypothetical protein [Treponema sp.]
MLGKLLRYDLKALMRILPALYLAILVLALAAGINSRVTAEGPIWSGDMRGKLVTVLGLMLIVLFIVNLVVVIMRFRDNFLRDEGYLMFTLPVSEWKLVASKAIAGVCSFLLTAAVEFAAVLIYGLVADYQNMLGELIRTLQYWFGENGRALVPLLIRIPTGLAFAFQQLCLVYAAMTISQLLPRFRGIAGCGVYLAVMLVTERLFSPFVGDFFFSSLGDLGLLLLLASAFAALCFWCSGFLLKRTLNLE